MSIDRGDIMKVPGPGGAAVDSSSASPAASQEAKVVHHVFFWLKRPNSIVDRDQLVAGLRALAKIPVIRSLQIGVPASTEQRDVVDASFGVSELMVFDSVADQKIYQDHPIHHDFIENCEHLWRKVIVYDMVTL